jgi:anti-repressor protein
MNELMKVETNEIGEQLVSGRVLYEFLEIDTKYNDWFKRMCEYGFLENIDFEAIAQKKVTAQGNETTYIDHIIKLDMAKEISMLSRNEKGKHLTKVMRTKLLNINSRMFTVLEYIENELRG